MSAYPITINTEKFVHKGGSKEYFLSRVINADGKAIIIRRYGKVGKATNIMVDKTTLAAVDRDLNKLIRERENHDYGTQGNPVQVTAGDATELVARIGPMIFPKLGKEAVEHIDPDFNTAGMKSKTAAPTEDESGRFLKPPEPQKLEITPEMIEEARLEQERQELAAKQARYANHPLYGRFA